MFMNIQLPIGPALFLEHHLPLPQEELLLHSTANNTQGIMNGALCFRNHRFVRTAHNRYVFPVILSSLPEPLKLTPSASSAKSSMSPVNWSTWATGLVPVVLWRTSTGGLQRLLFQYPQPPLSSFCSGNVMQNLSKHLLGNILYENIISGLKIGLTKFRI